MGKHHSDDYKETAIKYYMTTNDSLRNFWLLSYMMKNMIKTFGGQNK